MPFQRRVLMLWAIGLALNGARAFGQNEEAATQTTDTLSEMRQRADSAAVTTRERDDSVLQPLNETPLFRYSDARRNIIDAALWGYGDRGRPVALVKTEYYQVNGRRHWVYCLASLSDGLIEANWADGATFEAQQPGLTLQSIPGGPSPSATAPGRLLQLKRLAQRCSATIQNALDNREPMRLMPTPICRYADDDAGLMDGAVFGYTMGTNPDVLLVIELHRTESGGSEWRCGAAGMTSAGFVVRLDETEVLNQPFDPSVSGVPQAFARWMWRRVLEP